MSTHRESGPAGRIRHRIHVVGVSPRSGTTLMVELLVASYEIDGYAEHEMSIFDRPPGSYEIFCSKLPADLLNVGALLRFDPDLWVIAMLRDPRDVVVSRHAKAPSKYWVHLGVWKRRCKAMRSLAAHPRFVVVRYEDLVREPGEVQSDLERRLPFLRRKGEFREFHGRTAASSRAQEALGGVRPIDASSIGNWRNHKPRLLAQLERHGSVDDELVEFGYEHDEQWRCELAGVAADNGSTFMSEEPRVLDRARALGLRYGRTARYLYALMRRRSSP